MRFLCCSAVCLLTLLTLSAATGLASVPWWQSGVVYQIYPRSFQDTNNDGIGDLRGITQRLPYIKDLGADIIWISPFYPSPMHDFGYDIADFKGVDQIFGTLADFDALLARAHKLGLKVLLDFVPNHSSHMHPWFKESRSSKSNPKRDWYVWRDAPPKKDAPNNWQSVFGGNAWTFDKTTGQYYYHSFLPEQPDLNWRNPDVRKAMYEAMDFWLARGVDGFRVDAIAHLAEDEQFRDNPVNPNYKPTMSDFAKHQADHIVDHPYTRDVVAEMRKLVDKYPGERVLITEAYLPLQKLVRYYGREGAPASHLPFNFELIRTEWKPEVINKFVVDYEAALPNGAWPNWVLGNHDRNRVATRLGGDAQARVAAMMHLTLRGTPTIYYGEELGMTNIDVTPEMVQDPAEKREPGKGMGRDPARSPMQWDASKHSGFTSGTPWLPVGPDYATKNVASESKDLGSTYTLYKTLLKLRQTTPALAIGEFKSIKATPELMVYERSAGETKFLVALNFAAKTLPLGELTKNGKRVLSTYMDKDASGVSNLRAHEGILVELPRAVGTEHAQN